MSDINERDAMRGTVIGGWNGSKSKGVVQFVNNIMSLKKLPDELIWKRDLLALPEEYQPDAEFFLGWLLWNRKDNERAKQYWERVEKSESGTPYLKLHASAFLKQLKLQE